MLIARDPVPVMDAEMANAVVSAGSGTHSRFVADFERAHGQTLFGFVRGLGVKNDAAADVVQESILRLFDALCAGQAIRDSKAWTFHVAYRLAMDEHRRLARRLRLVRTRPGPTSVNDPSDDVEHQQVWSEVDRLPDRQRSVLFLRFRADLAFEDIGATLGITASAARSHCTQALATLRARLGQGAG